MIGERITLGSGKLFVLEYAAKDAIPADAMIEKPENELGAIQGGATLEYTNEFYEAKDDLGRYSKKMMTAENAVFKTGLITWNLKTLERLCQTARVNETDGKRTVKIGGIENYNDKRYIFRFLHPDETDGDIRLTIVGSNQSGLTIAFAKDKETVLGAEIKATPHDDSGTLIILEETLATAPVAP